MVFMHGKLHFVNVKTNGMHSYQGLTGVKASTPLKCLKTVANGIA
jgi:hypothetical protein